MEIKKRTKPTFARPNYGRTSRSRIKANWRRPRGIDNKKRFKWAYMGASPSIGYGQDKRIKDVHPAGKKEARVENLAQLEAVSDRFVRIAAGVGKKLKTKMLALAKSKHLRVLNP